MPSYGFFPAAGTDYTRGDEPAIAAALQRMGQSLKLHIIGLSGYRTPAHSVAVHGFANDPHTRGQASDSPGVESVPERTLNRFGLTRPFAGAGEADHVQLLGSANTGVKGDINASHPKKNQKTYSLAELWIQAGGPKNLAPIMAAIAMAESGGNIGAVNSKNTNGTEDYGLWQINSSHTQYNRNRLLTDPLYNARAAVAIYKSQGLHAWSTYNNGAYKSYTGTVNSGAFPSFGRTRPGSLDGGSGLSGELKADTQGSVFDSLAHDLESAAPYAIPIYGPLKLFDDASKGITNPLDFLKWIAWIFHPRNILRIVEFTTGLIIMGFSIHTMIQVYRDAPTVVDNRREKKATARRESEKTERARQRAPRDTRTTEQIQRQQRARRAKTAKSRSAKAAKTLALVAK